MAEKIMVSPKFSLQVRDFLKGLLVSVITSVLVVVQSTLDAGALTFNWKQIWMVAIGSAVAYLLKNYFAPPSVTTTYSSNEQAKTVASNIAEDNKTIVS